MDKDEKSAIRSLERAFKKCAEMGIEFCGMDGDLVYATKDAVEKAHKVEQRRGLYPDAVVANMNSFSGSGKINTSYSYKDSTGT